MAENVAQVFMGMRIQCAQCHNHPFDRWTMDDYYSFAAFFAQIGRKPAADPRETIVFNSGGGEVNHLVGGRVMPPKFLGGATPDCKGHDRREVLAEWLASPDNPYFARNLANIVWAHFFGRGIVDEVDDVRVSNPPVERPAAGCAGQALHRVQVRLQATGARYLHVAHLSAQHGDERHECVRRAQFFARHASADPGRGAARLHYAGDGNQGQVRRPAAGRPRRANCRRQHGHLFPDDIWPGIARNGLLLRSEDGAEPAARRCI